MPAVIRHCRDPEGIDIAAPIELPRGDADELGPEAQMMDGTAMPSNWKPGRGGAGIVTWEKHNAGHLWAMCRLIKCRPCSKSRPMMMSYPAMNHLQYRFTVEASGHALGVASRHRADPWRHQHGHWIDKTPRRAKGRANKRR